MARVIVLLAILVNLAWTPEARKGPIGNDPGHPALKENSPRMMAIMRSVDVSDRATKAWWTELTNKQDAYATKIKDKTVYCSAHEELLEDIQQINDQIDLVESGLDALQNQLTAIKAILADSDLNEQSGLHCDGENKKEPICVAIAGLEDELATQKQTLGQDRNNVAAEKRLVENYVCNCKYEDWAEKWGKCMNEDGQEISCGDGTQIETRKVKWAARNGGVVCDEGEGENGKTRRKACNEGCCPVDCVWEIWGEWEDCPPVCNSVQQQQVRRRNIITSDSCGGKECGTKNTEHKDCNIVAIHQKKIADLKAALEEKCPADAGKDAGGDDTEDGETDGGPVPP